MAEEIQTQVSENSSQVGSESTQQQSSGSEQQNSQQTVAGADAFNFWASNNQQQQQPAKREIPVENQVAMMNRLLEKANRQNQELAQKLQGYETAKPNIQDMYNGQQNGNERNVLEALSKQIDTKFNSLEDQRFNDKVSYESERYINKIQGIPDDVKQQFLEVVSSDAAKRGLRDGVLGFEDVYSIIAFPKLLEKYNALLASTQNKSNQNSAVGGKSTQASNESNETADPFADNPQLALDPAYVAEYKKKRGIQ